MVTEITNDMEIKERIKLLLTEMNNGVYEKDREIGLSLLAAFTGESILLFGPPGVVKSVIARRLKNAFSNANSFEYLMSRFSIPDGIVGPISLSRLKSSDKYERNIEDICQQLMSLFRWNMEGWACYSKYIINSDKWKSLS